MKETIFVIIGILLGLMISVCIVDNNYTHNSELTVVKPFTIKDKTYICREQIVSYNDINQKIIEVIICLI